MTHQPTEIHGIGAFEGFRSGLLNQQRAVQMAALALAELDDESFDLVVTQALRNRKFITAAKICRAVMK